jgi:small-conductance mechanosensitive channel
MGWGIAVVIAGAAILMLLSDLDINITPLRASAGVAGLALSLGAQTLIKDLTGNLDPQPEPGRDVGQWTAKP